MTKIIENKSFLELIEDEFGEDVFGRDLAGEFIPTGSLSLDMSIGPGGIPVGRFTEIYGSEGSGKTTIALSIARNAIKMGKKVLYIDVENMLDVNLVHGILGENLEMNMFVLLQPNTAEDALSIIEKGIESGEFGLIVLDSIGALAPGVEKEKELDELQMGTTPKLLAKFFRRSSYILRTLNKTAVLLINQVRDNIGSYSKSFSVPGGHALKHFCSLIISLTKGQEIKQDNVAVGITTSFVIKKNKLSSPFRGYEIPIIFGEGIATYKDFINFSESIGVLKKSGGHYKFGEEQLGNGVAKTIVYLKEHPELLDTIRQVCYNAVNSTKDLVKEIDDGTNLDS
jgi:recombination protein RecA